MPFRQCVFYAVCILYLIGSSSPVQSFSNSTTSSNGTSLENSQEMDYTVSPVKLGHERYRLQPLAAGGIGLLCGLVGTFIIIGLLVFVSKRRNEFVYEPAATSDTIVHI